MYLDLDIQKTIGDFSLDIAISSDAQKIGILGASGSGKSMTLRCIAGIDRPDSGHISLEGRALYDSSKKLNVRPQEREVGYLFQNYALFPTMTVSENIRCGIRVKGDEALELVSRCIEQFDLKGLEKRLPHELSGGQQQRVALARIMASRPKLVLLDEPFSALDSYLKNRIRRETITTLEKAGIRIIMVSHDRDELFSLSDEIFVIRKGEMLTHGTREQVFRDPERIEAAKLTGCKNFSDIEITRGREFFAKEWGAKLVSGKDISDSTLHIGYRAHDFVPLWEDDEDQENCIKFELEYEEELPFGKNIYFKVKGDDSRESSLCWIPDTKDIEKMALCGLPDRLKVLPEKILLLK